MCQILTEEQEAGPAYLIDLRLGLEPQTVAVSRILHDRYDLYEPM